MDSTVTLQLPSQSITYATVLADRTNRKLEDVLVEWIDQAAAKIPVQALPDEQIMALADSQLSLSEQDLLNQLLAQNREGALSPTEKIELDQIMKRYRRGMVRKAQAMNEAVSRGLMSPLN